VPDLFRRSCAPLVRRKRRRIQKSVDRLTEMWQTLSDDTQWHVHAVALGGIYIVACCFLGVAYAQTASRTPTLFLHTIKIPRPDGYSRFLLHVFVCIPFRASCVFIVYSLYRLGVENMLRGLAVVPLCQSFVWLRLFVFPENSLGQFGGRAWWARHRIIHSAFYLATAFVAVLAPKRAFVPLLFDVAFSCVVLLNHHTRCAVNQRTSKH
jgi:hypothetical protein